MLNLIDEPHAIFRTGDDVQIPTASGEVVPARVLDYNIGDGTYRVRVPDNGYCECAGLIYTVREGILLRYNPGYSVAATKKLLLSA